MNNSPCMGCEDRTIQPNCHMTCKRYLDFMKYREQKKKELRMLHESFHEFSAKPRMR